MKEILVWGDPRIEFGRLLIEPKLTWKGYGWNKCEEISIYEINEEDFNLIFEDKSSIKTWCDSKCIYSEGCNLGLPTMQAKINNKNITCWNELYFGEESSRRTYIHLLQYVCDTFKVSQIEDAYPILVELSKYNNLTLAELFRNYQEFEIRINVINIKDELGEHELGSDSFTIKCEKCYKERPLYESDMKDNNIVPTKCMCGGINKFKYWLDKL